MKKLMVILAISSLLYSCNKKGDNQSDNSSTFYSNKEIDLLGEMGKEKLKELNDILYMAPTLGYQGQMLDAYTNDSLDTKKDIKDILNILSYESVTQYAPYPNEPDYLLDTVIIERIKPEEYVSHFISYTITPQDNYGHYKLKLTGIAPSFNPHLNGLSIDYNYRAYYVRFEDLEKFMDKEAFNKLISICEKQFLNRYKFICKDEKQNSELLSLDGYYGAESHFNLMLKTFKSGKNGSLNFYNDPCFEKPMSTKEIEQKMQLKQMAMYAPYPDDPDYLVDTIVTYVYSPDPEYSTFILFENEKTGTLEFKIFPIAYALNANDPSGVYPLFWIKLKDLNSIMEGFEFSYFKKSIAFAYLNSFDL